MSVVESQAGAQGVQQLTQASEASQSTSLNNVADIYPLSPLQEGMLFHALEAPEQPTHVGQAIGTIEGPLNPEAFREAWTHVSARHQALRTAFVWEGLAAPVQVVRRVAPPPWTFVDLSNKSSLDREREFETWCADDAKRSFDLTAAPLMRLALFSFTESDHRFVWTIHHAIADGWSVSIAVDEAITLARDLMRGAAPKEVDSSQQAQFRSYISWLSRRDREKDESYWRERLKGASGLTTIGSPLLTSAALDRVPISQDLREHTTIEIDPATVDRIAQSARLARVTPNILYQAAWALILSRHASSDDVIYGVTSSGRSAPIKGIENILGLFITTTPTRVTFRDQETVRELLARLQAESVASSTHEHASLVDIQSWSDMPPGEPLFDALFVFGNYKPPSRLSVGGTRLASLRFKTPSSFPLALLLDPLPSGALALTAVTDPRRFDRKTSLGLIEGLHAAAIAVANNMDAQAIALDVLATDVSAELDALGRGITLPADPIDVLSAIVARAKERPQATAVIDAEHAITYDDLIVHAGRLAARLLELGLNPGEPVLVNMARGVEAIAAIVGILYAGGAYAPLDPSYPLARRRWAAVASGARFAVSDTSSRKDFTGLVEISFSELGALEPLSVPVPATPDTAAYVIFTSGSTGSPKGVVVSRANLAYSTEARRLFYNEQPATFLLLSSLAFDSSVVGLFWTLSGGGALYVAERRIEQDVERLALLLHAREITHLLCLPSLYSVLLDEAPAIRRAGLKTVIVAGETCPRDLPSRHRAASLSCRLVNEYGPTEASVWCVAADISAFDGSGEAPIGRPIPGARLRIVDHRGRLAPPGAVGELRIGGPGVAIGYLGLEDETAKRFVESTHGLEYRTGDLVRWRDDEQLDFLGRADGQVKVRGHRVELGEIEAAICDLPGVRVCVVTPVEKAPGVVAHLTAFIERDGMRGAEAGEASAIRAALSESLTEPMRPVAIRTLERLPTLPNGKVDRPALAHLAQLTSISSAKSVVEPRTDIERALAAIWRKVLDLEEVGVTDDFFDLGGDSLKSIRVYAAAKREGVPIDPGDVLELRTIERLAQAVDGVGGTASETPALDGGTEQRAFFLLYGGKRTQQALQAALGQRWRVELLVDHWDETPIAPRATIDALSTDWLARLRKIAPHGPYVLAGYSVGALAATEIGRQLIAEGETVDRLFLLDPMDDPTLFAGVEDTEVSPSSAKRQGLAARIRTTLESVRKRPPREALTFALASLRRAYEVLLLKRVMVARGRLAYWLNRPPPPKVADVYKTAVYDQAYPRHRLRPYPGAMLIFRTYANPANGKDYLWSALARGPYSEERFDCSHIGFRRDPVVLDAWARLLAERLNSEL
ncbi:MAG: amino acid adenylation domain-containing protein [Rhodobacteraceae bacterium]|nr:amino acid adenylation domain-containing protein [Paracoccaceae bacterium]